MALSVSLKNEDPRIVIVGPAGALDSNTYTILEKIMDDVLEKEPRAVIFDLVDLEYISSAGIRILLKTKKELKKNGGDLVLMNLNPLIRKIFDIINAFPSHEFLKHSDDLERYVKEIASS